MTGKDGVPSLPDAPKERCLFGGEILHRIGSDAVPAAPFPHKPREDGHANRYTGEEQTN
jgi:hypothetical protein